MALSLAKAEAVQEMLHDFNPKMMISIRSAGENATKEKMVIVTIEKLVLAGPDLKTLAEITDDQTVTFDRSGKNLRMIIS